MYIEKVAENIFRIPITLPDNPLRELNSYLIKDPKCSLLIDTGFCLDACREALLNGLNELVESPQAIDIFLTHMHSDHAGLAADIVGEHRRIFVSVKDHGLLTARGAEEGVMLRKLFEGYSAAGMPAFILDNMTKINPAIAYSPRTKSTRYRSVNDGEILSAGGYSLRCVSTPGHTPGHMCLWDEQSGIMFTGDHVLFDITPNITAWSFVHDSLDDYLNSLRTVSKYPVKKALPGHRKTGDFHARVEELLRHHHARLAEIEDIISAAPGSTTYEIAGKMRWKIRANNWSDFPPAQKIFAVGECMSHLDYLLHRDRITSQKDGNVACYFRQ